MRRSCAGIDGNRVIETEDLVCFYAWITAGVLVNIVPYIVEKIGFIGRLVDAVNIRPLFEQLSLVSGIHSTVGVAVP